MNSWCKFKFSNLIRGTLLFRSGGRTKDLRSVLTWILKSSSELEVKSYLHISLTLIHFQGQAKVGRSQMSITFQAAKVHCTTFKSAHLQQKYWGCNLFWSCTTKESYKISNCVGFHFQKHTSNGYFHTKFSWQLKSMMLGILPQQNILLSQFPSSVPVAPGGPDALVALVALCSSV